MSSNPETNENKTPRSCKGSRCWRIPFVILGIVLIKGAVVLALWNALVPELFHGPVVNYFQAVGLVILAKLLLSGPRCGFRRGHWRFGPPWRQWEGLSPEEREKLRNEIRGCCE